MPKLIRTGDDGDNTEHEVARGMLTIGRSPECDISLSHPSVSRLHAVIEASDEGLEIRDQESKHGIRVNGSKVTDAVLRDGDELKVGKVAFKVAFEAAPAPRKRDSARKAGGTGKAVDGEEGARIRSSRRLKMEVFGGARLTKTQQTIIKIVCAAIMLICIYFALKVITSRRRGGGRTINRVTYFDETEEPRRLLDEARDLARRAREYELDGDTVEANVLMSEARDKINRAQGLADALEQKYPGEGYRSIHKLTTEINQKGQIIRQEAFRLNMQLKRDRGEI